MLKSRKREINEFVKKHINTSNVKLMLLFFPLLVILIKQIEEGKFQLDIFLDTSILISFLIVFICDILASLIINIVEIKTEDAVKISEDYECLVDKYCLEQSKMITFSNRNGETIYIPVISIFEVDIDKNNLKDLDMIFEYDNSKYTLPKQIADNSDIIFSAHKHSTVYNCVNIRLNDISVDSNKIKLVYGFTTYYDSLITNRAMDYRLKNNRSIRDIYEPGPILSDLNKSKMSNHLGFNGFVELSDGNIVFVKRNNNLSIAKGFWQQSIAASLKTKYCLDENKNLTKEGIFNAIKNEIKDELKIEISEKDIVSTSVFAFYRDLVEGGKPQFLFYCKIKNYDRYSFEKNFLANYKNIKNKTEIDGRTFKYFTIDELRNCDFSIDCMIDSKRQKYNMMPSSIASIIMMLRNKCN